MLWSCTTVIMFCLFCCFFLLDVGRFSTTVMNSFYSLYLREVEDLHRYYFYSSIVVFFFWVCWSVLSCLFVWVELSLLGYSAATHCRDSARVVFYTNGRRSFCTCEQNNRLMWAQPIRFWVFDFWTLAPALFLYLFKALSHCLSRSYALSILFKKCSQLNLFRLFP